MSALTDRERVAILRSACVELYGEARMAGDCEALDSGWVCGMLRGALEQTRMDSDVIPLEGAVAEAQSA